MIYHSLSSKNQSVNPVYTETYQGKTIRVFPDGEWLRFEYANTCTLHPKDSSVHFGLILARSVIDSGIFAV